MMIRDAVATALFLAAESNLTYEKANESLRKKITTFLLPCLLLPRLSRVERRENVFSVGDVAQFGAADGGDESNERFAVIDDLAREKRLAEVAQRRQRRRIDGT